MKSFFNLPKCDVLLNNYVCKFNQRRLTCVNGAVRHLYHLHVDLVSIVDSCYYYYHYFYFIDMGLAV